MKHRNWLLVAAVSLLLAGTSFAQFQPQVGPAPFASLSGGQFDTVNLGNLNTYFTIPVRHKAGRTTNFDYDLVYNSYVWQNVSNQWQLVKGYPIPGWSGLSQAGQSYITYSRVENSSGQCTADGRNFYSYQIWTYSSFAYYDNSGARNDFNISWQVVTNTGSGICGPTQAYYPSAATQTSSTPNFTLKVTPVCCGSDVTPTLTSKNATLTAPIVVNATWGTQSSVDRNGNKITLTNGVYTDTLGQTVLSVSGTAPSPTTLLYAAPSGVNATYTVKYSSLTVHTNFQCSGVSEYPATSQNLVTEIDLPDQSVNPSSKYTITYETTPGDNHTPHYVTGRIASVTLPTGASISYTYDNGGLGSGVGANNTGVFCSDGSTPRLTRNLSTGEQWTYARSGNGSSWTTTVVDPTSNQTVVSFVPVGSDAYETERQVYQGSSTLLSTSFTCYNGNTSNPTTSCPTATVSAPIAQVTKFLYLPDTSASSKVSRNDTFFNLNQGGNVSEVDEYDYGTGSAPSTPTRKTLTNYALYGNWWEPTSIQVEDGSSTVKASTTFGYDQTTPTTISGTPQHNSGWNFANLTTVSKQVSGTVTLYRKFTYYDSGVVKSATDWGTSTSGGPNTTNYAYSSTPQGNSTQSCGNSFVTSISEPLSLTRGFTWDCNGGVQTSVTDENGKTASVYYTTTTGITGTPDAYYWRPYATTDQLSPANETSLTYPSYTASESSLLFNGGHSVVDQRVKSDVWGRPILNQALEGPGLTTYDSIQTDYDSLGRVWKSYLPFTNATDASCSGTCPHVTQTYDALNRLVSITDANPTPGTVNYTFTKNDVLQVLGPAPNGENTKQKQLEYDGLGRLTSVCELTGTANGGGTCNQTGTASPPTGFWTTYAYDILGNMTGVTQNAQAATASQQTRAYTFDMLSRMLTEQNPETGTIHYTYDTADSTCGSYSSPGDLVEKEDAGNNYTCMKYDALHRLIQITYPAGTYATPTTPTKCFVYGSVTVNSISMLNDNLSPGETYTTNATSCTGSGKIVDEGFSYTARGEVADVWQQTPNSGGWQHVNATYWAHGRINVLNGGTSPLPGLPAITYGASDGSGMDSKGRITKVTAPTGQQNPVTSVNWNVADHVTGVTFGSSDADSYQYDANTGRITQYQLGMGSLSQTGVLTWNSNGTLSKLAITDQINSANTHTCKYGDPSASVAGYDDLGRLISANCGSAWSQTFSFDPFGNLSKTGSSQFLPTYTNGSNGGPTNQYYQISGGASGTTNYYDANGNVKNDLVHSYTWDADGNMLSVDGSTVSMIYDAMDRMIEQTRGSSHTQIVYGPYGMKLALMNGQSLMNAFVKLPGGARAVYNNSGLAYYRHSDHLGSSRLATTTSRTKQYDVAYAPYGEDYNGSGTTDLAFTDQNQDTVGGGWTTNLYDFMLREYRTGHGRWTSPDPAGLTVVDPTNPQTWNRYAYVLNDPMVAIDFLGDSCYNASGDEIPAGTAAQCWANGGFSWYDPISGNHSVNPSSASSSATASAVPDPDYGYDNFLNTILNTNTINFNIPSFSVDNRNWYQKLNEAFLNWMKVHQKALDRSFCTVTPGVVNETNQEIAQLQGRPSPPSDDSNGAGQNYIWVNGTQMPNIQSTKNGPDHNRGFGPVANSAAATKAGGAAAGLTYLNNAGTCFQNTK